MRMNDGSHDEKSHLRGNVFESLMTKMKGNFS